MSLYVIGDLHLSFGGNKPMNIFSGWEHHTDILESQWRKTIRQEDTVVLAGDLSWGINLEEALPDLQWIDALPAKRKILLKGNHDYWWTTVTKMQNFFQEHQLHSLSILHNNAYSYEQYGICGTRGWVNMLSDTPDPADEKILAREAQRLDVSLTAAEQQGQSPIVFLHYPPIYGASCNYAMLDVLWKHEVRHCYYGHIHGKAHSHAINGERDGIVYHLISSDYVHFMPQKVI